MTLLDHLSPASVAVVLLIGAVTTALGGLVTVGIFRLVDRSAGAPDSPAGGNDPAEPVTEAGEILRGGAWVGALERVAVFSALVLGWPEGIAVVLAIKGLGRYAELKSERSGAAGERFIIGTFTSLLTAALGAGLALWAASAITP